MSAEEMFMQEVLHMQIHRESHLEDQWHKGCRCNLAANGNQQPRRRAYVVQANRVLNHPHESNIGVLYMKTINENLTVKSLKKWERKSTFGELLPMW